MIFFAKPLDVSSGNIYVEKKPYGLSSINVEIGQSINVALKLVQTERERNKYKNIWVNCHHQPSQSNHVECKKSTKSNNTLHLYTITGKSAGIVTLEARSADASGKLLAFVKIVIKDTRYVSKVGKDAWLLVKLDNGNMVSLPWCLKVNVLQTKNDRDHFEILEGAYKGSKASVSLKNKSTGESYLIRGNKHLSPAQVTFNRATQSLSFGGKGPFSAFSGAFGAYTQIGTGSYELSIPDAPHSATRAAYDAYTNYHKTWFRIGTSLSGSRYLHVGEISEGCVTVRAFQFDPQKPAPAGFTDLPTLPNGALGLPYPATIAPLASWTDLYEYLINRRLSDLSVGTLTVL